MQTTKGVAPTTITNLTKINDLLLKNHASVKRLNEIEERLTLAKITEVSRRARQINFHCLNELVYTLNQANLNEYSYTIRLLFQIFGLCEDLFLEDYIGYMQLFLKETKGMNRRHSRGSASLRSQDFKN